MASSTMATKILLSILILSTLFIIQASCRDLQARSPSSSSSSKAITKYKKWMEKHSVKYESKAEESKRFKVFKENLKTIETHNKKSNATFWLKLTQFADLTADEFAAKKLGYRPPPNFKQNAAAAAAKTTDDNDYEYFRTVPESVNWTAKGVVTPVKFQGYYCGDCWAFSAVGAVESAVALKTGQLISLSEQQLLDCADSHGCGGGLMDYAFQYIIQNDGIASESEYPYYAQQNMCYSYYEAPAAQIRGYNYVPQGENYLTYAVSRQPLSVSVATSGTVPNLWQLYGGGVLSGDSCSDSRDHAVLLVGYGTTEDGIDYWLVKNSWGESWGENGYIRLQRNYSPMGTCGVAEGALYPIA